MLRNILATAICFIISIHVGNAASGKSTNNPTKANAAIAFSKKENRKSGIADIQYTLTEKSEVEMGVYNLLGSKIVSLENNVKAKGSYSGQWDATSFPEGIYVISVKVNGKAVQRKFMIIQ